MKLPRLAPRPALLALAVVSLAALPAAHADIIYSQNFESLTANTTLIGQGGFSGNTTVLVSNVGGGLNYAGGNNTYLNGGNNYLRLDTASANGGNGNLGAVGFTSTSNATLYFSFTFNYKNFKDDVQDTSSDFFRIQFSNTTASTTDFLGVQLSGGTGNNTLTQTNLGVRARNASGGTTPDSGRVAPNTFMTVDGTTTYFIAGSLTWNGTKSAYDTITMWVNPTTQGSAPASSSDYFYTATASTTGSTLTSLSGLILQSGQTNGNFDTNDVLKIDNIRLGTTFADVQAVPEPSAVAAAFAVGLGLVVVGRIRRRRQS